MNHSRTNDFISNVLKTGMMCGKIKRGTLYFIIETTNDDQQKTIDNADVNAENSNCFPRCTNTSSL